MNELLLKNKKVAELFNSCFQSITRLSRFIWMVFRINRSNLHPSITNIKRNYKIVSELSFKSVSEEFVKDIVKRQQFSRLFKIIVPVHKKRIQLIKQIINQSVYYLYYQKSLKK